MISFKKNARILFIGDSITDCGRSRENPQLLGGGYAMMTAAKLLAKYPELNLSFLNFGISGNRIRDLKSRWTDDCIRHKPDILSILIGINDTWRRYDSNDATEASAFENDCRHILQQAKKEVGCQIIILEPFVLPVPDDRKKWREDLDQKIKASRELALEYADVYVPLDGIFASASCRQKPAYWAGDGVHPTMAGHMLMANAWMEYAGV
ncbi:MAG TPA: GDSL family lipase [Lentisphaeria bacterium]|nr:MAG: GDSL family lipase [Lentisphaerae bacterium GWF2_50_93]HCE42907.1 GDSL family lipase [Lentisphaeria bacterium]